jgi:hypothetical protein
LSDFFKITYTKKLLCVVFKSTLQFIFKRTFDTLKHLNFHDLNFISRHFLLNSFHEILKSETTKNVMQNPNRDFNVFRYYRSVPPFDMSKDGKICPGTERGTECNEGRNGTERKALKSRCGFCIYDKNKSCMVCFYTKNENRSIRNNFNF